MIGKITVKRIMKRTAGLAAAAGAAVAARGPGRSACILVYHRIADLPFVDPHLDDWNVDPATFEQHVAALAASAEIIPLSDVPRRLAEDGESQRPLVCLTFDDGYANFYTRALPVLRRYAAPATLFVVTDVVGRSGPMPFDAWSLANGGRTGAEAWRPISWNELDQCMASGIVAVGAHSHTHRNGLSSTRTQLDEEARRSRSILVEHFGESAGGAYSYPYGSRRLGQVTDQYIAAVGGAGFHLAVTTDLGLATPGEDPLALPRVEAHALDTPAVLRAKVQGVLGPYRLTDQLRQAKRAGQSPSYGA